jgi:hypothetical protein
MHDETTNEGIDMSQMSNQHLIITDALAKETNIPWEDMVEKVFTVFDPVDHTAPLKGHDEEFAWHVSFDHRLWLIITTREHVVSIARID